MVQETHEAAKTGQVADQAAQIYDELFVPALFGPWAKRLADALHLRPGDDVLDVACGTGAFALEAEGRIGPDGTITGIDLNAGMLAVARQKAPQHTWREGDAQALPFEDSTFEVAACQLGMMFFPEPAKAIREMWRVLRPEGRLGVVIWGPLEQAPGYQTLAKILADVLGKDAAAALETPFNLGDEGRLDSLFEAGGVPGAAVETQTGTVQFPTLETLLHTEIRGWVLGDQVDDRQFEQVLERSKEAMRPYVQQDGSVQFPIVARVITATKP